ncbi:NAD-dependent epimerase/dehydratase family protein [Saccharospirillum mangrovi]|uniref:NAD-dependent epimerase/dehydratase family protein n=1 Tax=Saccharospirillum mangrovi TaxID=2161747 RepID=UPI000D36C7EA|nr:NAD-dependent epimerase/dehydratase family protein [Saccharospirillum mangrovi]
MAGTQLLAGVGDLNRRVVRRFLERGKQVVGFRRRAADPSLGFEQQSLDLATQRWPDVGAAGIVVALSAGERTPEGYRRAYVEPIQQLAASLAHWSQPPKRVVVVSSTRVYGADDGRDMDETSPPEPTDWAGELLLEMEALVADLPVPTVVARLSGLYGPGRDWLRRQARKADVEPPARNHWTNRIHIDDAAAALVHLMLDVAEPEACYLVSDRQSAPLFDVLAYLRELESLPALADTPVIDGGKQLRADRLAGSGFVWRYPDFRAGGYESQ